MKNDFEITEVEITEGGEKKRFQVSHPVVPSFRTKAISILRQLGVELYPDVIELPSWLTKLPKFLQVPLLEQKPELFPFHKLYVPKNSVLTSQDWEFLAQLPEICHLSISSEHLAPSCFESIKHLKKLEVLVLHSASLDDRYCLELPELPELRLIDVIGTSITKKGLAHLEKLYPDARLISNVV